MRTYVALLAMLSTILLSSLSFAGQPANGYASLQRTGTAAPNMRMNLPETYIVISNFSNFYIHAVIPGTDVDQPINAHSTGVITHPTYYGNTRVVIYNEFNVSEFDMSFCHHAIVSIDGSPYHFSLSPNDRYCVN